MREEPCSTGWMICFVSLFIRCGGFFGESVSKLNLQPAAASNLKITSLPWNYKTITSTLLLAMSGDTLE